MKPSDIELLTECLDLLAGISVAPELIGKERLEHVRNKLIISAQELRIKELYKIAINMYGVENPKIFKPVWYLGIIIGIVLLFLSPSKTIIEFV
jgi:hypothetical protein